MDTRALNSAILVILVIGCVGEPTHSFSSMQPALQFGPSDPRLVFHSDQHGNHDIYLMNADGSGLTRVTTNPAHDVEPDWSPDETRIVFRSDRDANGDSEIYTVNADGSGETRLTTDPSDAAQPAWSPDGTRIAFLAIRDGNPDIYVMNADGSGVTRLTTDPEWDTHPAWSPDGARIAFTSWPGGNPEIYSMNVDGTGITRLTTDPAVDIEPAWSPDGSQIAFRSNRVGNSDVFVMNADGTGVRQLTTDGAFDGDPAWSPDGTWIAFTSSRDGNDDVYVMNASDGSDQTRLTVDPGSDRDPDWGAGLPLDLSDYCNGADDLDDSACIRDWIAAGRASPDMRLVATAGTYLYRQPFQMYSGLQLDCVGSNQTTFQNNGGTGLFLSAATAVHGVRIANCNFDVRGSSVNFLAVIAVNPKGIDPSTDIALYGNRIYDSAIPGQMPPQQRQYIVLLNCHDCRVVGNHLSEGGRIKLGRPGRRLLIRNNTVEHANDNAITVVDIAADPNVSEDITIDGNRILNPLVIGIFFGVDGENQVASSLTTRRIRIEGNYIEGNWRGACINGTLPAITDDVQVIDNTCRKTGPTIPFAAGIAVKRTNRAANPATNIQIARNALIATLAPGVVALDYGGMFFTGSHSGVSVVDNVISNVGSRAMLFRNCAIADATIVGNTLVGGSLVIECSVQGEVQTR